jgi:hypothetical protein
VSASRIRLYSHRSSTSPGDVPVSSACICNYASFHASPTLSSKKTAPSHHVPERVWLAHLIFDLVLLSSPGMQSHASESSPFSPALFLICFAGRRKGSTVFRRPAPRALSPVHLAAGARAPAIFHVIPTAITLEPDCCFFFFFFLSLL